MNPEEAIKEIVRLTQEGRIVWEMNMANQSLTEGTDEIIDSYFLARHKGKILRAYEAKYKRYMDDIVSFWDGETRLEIVDLNGILIWRFPFSKWTSDLISAIRYQVANVDDFLTNLWIEDDL